MLMFLDYDRMISQAQFMLDRMILGRVNTQKSEVYLLKYRKRYVINIYSAMIFF